MNTALLTKWLWKFYQVSDLLWCKIIKSQYFHNKSLRNVCSQSTGFSYFCKEVLYSLDIFFKYIKVEVGEGTGIAFCQGIWSTNVPLREKFLSLYELACNKDGIGMSGIGICNLKGI